ALIEDLLGYARVEAGQEIVSAETLLLGDIIEQSLILVRPLAQKKGLRMMVEGPPSQVELHTDVPKLRQILTNILANAVKFTDAGDVILLVRIAGINPDVRVFFEVTDTGRGIARENH